MVWIWLSILILTLVIEIISFEIDCVWFSIGSLVALVMSLFDGCPIWAQIVAFLVVSVALLCSLGIICRKLLKNTKTKTNLDTVIGTVHTLLKPIEPESPGEIKVNDVTWRAVTKDGSSLAANEKVKVVSVEGNKFIVEKEN